MIDVLKVPVGARLRLTNGDAVEVVENMADGQWLLVRDVADPAAEAELRHAGELAEVVDE